MNRILSIVVTLCLVSAVACSSTQKVDLFRVNDNGEVVNIGASQDEKILYGHFMSENDYQRARLLMTEPSEDSVLPVCYIELSQGDGIRIEPCANAVMVNEGPALNAPEHVDVIGIYHVEEAPWGAYDLYQYIEGNWQKRFSAAILDEHWQSGIDVIRRDPSDPNRVFLTISHSDDEGNISLNKTLVSMDVALAPKHTQDKVMGKPAQEINEQMVDATEEKLEAAEAVEAVEADQTDETDETVSDPPSQDTAALE